jgi:hypothetical protein
VIPSITALSQYLLEDLHDYQTQTIAKTPFGDSEESPSSIGPGKSVEQFLPPTGHVHDKERVSNVAQSSQVNWQEASNDMGATPLQVACAAMVRSLTKKYRDRVSPEANAVAEEKFRRSNDRCKNWELRIENSWDEELFGCFLKEIDDFFHPCGLPLISTVDQIFESGRCGPGSSLGANGNDFYSKLFSSRLSATSFEVYYQYAERAAKYPIWGNAEFNRLIAHGLPSIVRESVVTFVQKDLTQTRSICTEPSLNMFFQLGVGEILRARLKEHFGIDLSVQPERNVRLARRGSTDGSIATIDLESASDSIGMNLCQTVLPGWFFDLLCDYRSPETSISGKSVVLEMVSTMGNGFTFPLQTAIFSCVVKAVVRQYGDESVRANTRRARWGVFGDDIICPSKMANRVVSLLALLGFRVNRDKSYTSVYGRFRESCGGDYYNGHNVRGVYLKRLDTLQSRYVAINLLNEWSARWGIPLPRCVGYLQDSVRLLAVPPWAPVDSGIRVPLSYCRRWGWSAYDSKNNSFVFKCYEPHPYSIYISESRLTSTRKTRRLSKLTYNPSGLLMAFVGGYIEDSKITIALKQGESGRYRTRLRKSPFWGPSVTQVDMHRPDFWGWWNTIVEFNLR